MARSLFSMLGERRALVQGLRRHREALLNAERSLRDLDGAILGRLISADRKTVCFDDEGETEIVRIQYDGRGKPVTVCVEEAVNALRVPTPSEDEVEVIDDIPISTGHLAAGFHDSAIGDDGPGRSTACPSCGAVGRGCDCIARTLATLADLPGPDVDPDSREAEMGPGVVPLNVRQPSDAEIDEAAFAEAMSDFPALEL